MLAVYPALARSYMAGKENVCLSNAYAHHNVSIFREIQCINFQSDSPSKGAGECVSRSQPGLSFPIKQTEAPKTTQGCCKNSIGPLPIFSETDENYLG